MAVDSHDKDGEKDSGWNLKDFAALATGSLGVFTALAGSAAVGGGVERVAREGPFLVAAALSAFTLATVFAALGILLSSAGARGVDRRRLFKSLTRWWLPISIFLFVVGLGSSYWAVLRGAGNRSRATVDVAVKQSSDGAMLEAAAHAGGLNASEFVRLKVARISGRAAFRDDQPIYAGAQGPNAAGNVEFKFTLPLPPGPYDAILVKVWQRDKEPVCEPYGTKGGKGGGRFACVTVLVRP